MKPAVSVLDTVAVLADLPAHGLTAGEVGAVVDDLGGGVFEVEFVDRDGQTYGLVPLKSEQIVVLHTRGSSVRWGGAAA